MERIDRREILGLAEYEEIRAQFRSRVIEEKKRRRVRLGPKVSALFENRDTVLLQIQEMLRTERITRPAAVQHEIDTYNENIPGPDELSCTFMIEIPNADERETFLRSATRFERHLALVVDGDRIPARASDRGNAPDERTTAVHYVKFTLPTAVVSRLRGLSEKDRAPVIELRVEHPAYEAAVTLPRETVAEILGDLGP